MRRIEIEDLIVELLAADAGRDPHELRAELEAAGSEMPVDSVVAAGVLGRIQARVGVTLPATAETAPALRSVHRFADAIWTLLEERGLTERALA